MQQLYAAFMKNGCSLAEINPLVTTPAGDVVALDAKMVIDDNELDRHAEIAALRDESAEAPSEVQARNANLTFIKLDGNVGCVVNGAGLAMATMDLVKYYGGEPANFLDIGGSSNPGEGRQRAQDHHRRSEREGDSVQHLRRHHAHRRRRERHRHRDEAESTQGADRHPAHRNQRRDRHEDSAGERLLGVVGHGRSGEEGRAAREGRTGRMSIFIDKNTTLIVQGITGRDGSFHTKQMLEYGTKVVAGVTPGKGGQKFEGTVPIFNTVADAVAATGREHVGHLRAADVRRRRDSRGGRRRREADRRDHRRRARARHDARLSVREREGRAAHRPELPGPHHARDSPRSGSFRAASARPGNVGVVSRSGTLTYEVVYQLTRAGLGQSTCVGIGGDPINGTNFIDCLAAFEADPDTKAVAMMGEIGGTDEQEAAAFVKQHMKKPVVGFIAGQTAPPGRRMGHAGAIISGSSGTAAEKIAGVRGDAGMGVAKRPMDFVELLKARTVRRAMKLADFLAPSRVLVPLAMRNARRRACRRCSSVSSASGAIADLERLQRPRRGGARRGHGGDRRPRVSPALSHRHRVGAAGRARRVPEGVRVSSTRARSSARRSS